LAHKPHQPSERPASFARERAMPFAVEVGDHARRGGHPVQSPVSGSGPRASQL
jgi:hypothetical protein